MCKIGVTSSIMLIYCAHNVLVDTLQLIMFASFLDLFYNVFELIISNSRATLMNYNNLFPLTLEGITPLYPIITTLFGSLLYAALFQFGYNRIIEKLYGETVGWKIIYRVQIYLFMVNLPLIFLTILGVTYNSSLLPFQVALKIDQIYILIICGYICYLQESRQTPIRGFVVIKDSIVIVLCLCLLIPLYIKGVVSYQQFLTIAPTYFISLAVQIYTNQIQNCLLLAFKIKQKNIYRSSFLLTEQSHPSNFLQIKDIISNNQEQIQQQIDDFISIAHKLNKENEELTVLTNFARLFIPIKKAYEINEQIKSKQIHEHFVQSWQKVQYDYLYDKQKQDEDTQKVYSFNNSASTLMLKKTFTTDSVLDNDQNQKEIEQSILNKTMKYLCYPLFISKDITGRLRYFIDYLIVILIIVTMFLMSNSIAYFSLFFPQQQNIVSLIYAALLFYPIAKYFIKISQGTNDYDFLAIFMEGMTIKIFSFSIGLCILNIMNNNNLIESQGSTMISFITRIVTIVGFCAFLSWKRFAMRHNNLKIFVGVFIVSHLARILQEDIMDYF